MGCLFSKSGGGSRADKYLVADTHGGGGGKAGDGKAYSWEQDKAKLNPKDFIFRDLNGQVAVKEPGSINGQQFVIDTCEDCDIYVLDHCAMVTIDDCKNCRIFIGPTSSSIFIRDCSNVKLVGACRQFRTRDCKDVEAMLYCSTRPVIETSKGHNFGCFDLNYHGLAEHMGKCSFSPFTNFFSHIHDFNPAKNLNWGFTPEGTDCLSFLAPVPDEIAQLECMRPGAPPAVLKTHGERPPPGGPFVFCLFPSSVPVAKVFEFALEYSESTTLLRTNTVALEKSQVEDIVQNAGAGAGAMAGALGSGKCIGLEFQGAGAEAVGAAARALGGVVTSNTDAAASFRFLGIEG